MEVVAQGAVRAGSIVWQPARGRFSLAVIAKVTFSLAPGESPLAGEQEPLYDADACWDDDLARSLVQSTDLVPRKLRPEVLLTGHARSKDGAPVSSLLARLAVGTADKSVRAVGDRWFSKEGVLSEPLKFSKMLLAYERAAGGPSTDNPTGVAMGVDARPDAWGRVLVPNLEPPGASVSGRRDLVAPIGFGPIAPWWRSRARKLGRHPEDWDSARWHERPLPEGFDASFWNAAPLDQQLFYLNGNERIVLENLHRDHPQLTTRLASVDMRAEIELAGARPREVPLVPDTLVIDTDRGIAMLVARAVASLDHPERAVRAIVLVAPRGAKTGVHGVFPVTDEETDAAGSTQQLKARPPDPQLPRWLASESAPRAPARPPPAPEDGALPFRPKTLDPGAKAPPEASPAAPPPAAPPPATATLPMTASATATLPIPVAIAAARSTGLPFAPTPPVPTAPVATPHVPTVPIATASIPTAPVATPHVPTAPIATAPIPTAPVQAAIFVRPPPLLYVPPPPPAEPAISEELVPPPLLGPLATPEMIRAHEARLSAKGDDEAAPESERREEVASVAHLDPPALTQELSLERCAELDASIGRRPQQMKEILHAAHMDPPAFQRAKSLHREAITAEIRRGKSVLLKMYDAAYVAQLEKERGPVSADEYARIVVAAERGETLLVPLLLGVGPEALPRIQRLWMGKMARDAALGKKARDAIARARAE